MPQPKWFIKDDVQGIDQEKWLVDYIEATVIANKHRMKDWKAETIFKFEEKFPRDIRKKLYTGKGKRKRFERMETAEEAEERTRNRDKQLGYWLGTYVKKIIARVEQRERPVPEYLQIQEFKASVVPRAHSARDLFITDNPHVMHDALEVARASGTIDRSELQKIANEAITAKMGQLTAEELASYVTRSNEEKELRRAERDALKPDTTTMSSQRMSVDQRLKQLVDLEFTMQQAIHLWAEETHTEIVVMYGGADGTGGIRKWLMSNRDPADPKNFVDVVRDRNSAAHGVLKTFDDFLIEHRGFSTLDGSPCTTAPSTADHAAGSTPLLATAISSTGVDKAPSASIDAVAALGSSPADDIPPSPISIELPPLASAFASPSAACIASSSTDSSSHATDTMAHPSCDLSIAPSTDAIISSPPNTVITPGSPLPDTMAMLPSHVVDVSSVIVTIPSSSNMSATGTASLSVSNDGTGTVRARHGKKNKTMVKSGNANDGALKADNKQAPSRPRRAKALAGVKAAVASVAPKRKACADPPALIPKVKRARNSRVI